MILVTDLVFKVTSLSRSPTFKKTTVKSAFSELFLRNQWVFLCQTCIVTLFRGRKELDSDDLDLILKVQSYQNCVGSAVGQW